MSLTALIPTPYRWLIFVLAAMALLAFGYMKGVQHEEGAQAKRDLQNERASAVLVGKRASSSNKVELKYAPALTQIRTVTKETVRYVPQFVRVDECRLSGGFRVYHDAASQGLVPDPARVPDAAAVSAQVVAATVADNYGTCLANAKQLEGLQEWVTEQLKLNPQAGAK